MGKTVKVDSSENNTCFKLSTAQDLLLASMKLTFAIGTNDQRFGYNHEYLLCGALDKLDKVLVGTGE